MWILLPCLQQITTHSWIPKNSCDTFLYFPPSNILIAVGDPGITEKEDADSVFMEMICPSGTNPDDSPLYVLCCNDTCSFTWTGAEHINQVSNRK